MKTTVLITGASSGIGCSLARVFAANGVDLILVARREDKLNQLKFELEQDYQCRVTCIAKDLSVANAAQEIGNQLERANITVDYLINNAGVGTGGVFAESDWEQEEKIIDLNIKALTHMTRVFLPGMLERDRGHIVNIGSIVSFMPSPMMVVYGASKAFLLSFSKAISLQCDDSNVNVSAICPGPTHSGFAEAADLEGINLFAGELPTSDEVADFIFKEMQKGSEVAVHGFMNRLMIKLMAITPRKTIVQLNQQALARAEQAEMMP